MLTDADCKNASCPSDKKRVRLSDAGNLYLEVTPNGAKRWFWKYWLNSKERRLALGSYPTISLKAARIARDAAKAEKAAGVDPVLARQQEKMRQTLTADNSFSKLSLCSGTKNKSLIGAIVMPLGPSHGWSVICFLSSETVPWKALLQPTCSPPCTALSNEGL